MAGISTILGVWTLGQTFNKLKEQGISIAKNSFNIRSACKELGIPLPVEDDYKVLYIETLLKLCDGKYEYQVWFPLFELEIVFSAFKEADQKGLVGIFSRELEQQLHVNDKLKELKKFNAVPSDLINDFQNLFSDFKSSVKTPIETDVIEKLSRIETAVSREQKKEDRSALDQKSSTNLIEQFKSASYILADSPNTFNNLEDSHIDRDETKSLLDWIEKPLEKEEKPIALLVGNAGSGKTTILRDIYEELNKNDIPILGIKADRFYAQSIKVLANKLDVDEQILNSFRAILNEKEKLVLLIDQIDALSQSLSARREYLDTINKLVRDASDLSGIRIIISIRTFDLAYDDDFNFYKKQKEIKVKGLTKPQIENVLARIGFPITQLTDTLLDLLKTPLHLSVFCKVYGENKSFQDIKTLHDLYGKLWDEKIVNIKKEDQPNKKKCKKLLFKLAKDMNEDQWITLSSSKYKEDYKAELLYLQSAGLINTPNNEIQFFHQTFYDFCFAKRFVEKGESLTEFILKKNQTLFVRSAVKMILNFQRTDDHDSYIENYQEIITSGKYRFHIKLLLINLLGFIIDPTEKEKKFVSEIVLRRSETYYIFLESALSSGWFKFLQEETVVFADIFNANGTNESFEFIITDQRIEIANFWYQFFRKHLPEKRSQIINILEIQPESDNKDNLIVSCLFILKKWDVPDAFKLLESCQAKGLIDGFTLYKILENICIYDFDYAIKTYQEILKKKSIEEEKEYVQADDSIVKQLLKPFKGIPQFSHYDENLLEKMREANTEKFMEFGVSQCLSYIKSKNKDYYKEKYPDYGCVNDWVFKNFYFDDIDDNCNNHKVIFKETALAIKSLAKEENEVFSKFVENNIDSKFISILKLLIYGFIENPATYSHEIVTLIRNLDNKNGFLVNNHFYLFIRELIKVSFNYLSQAQKQFIIDFICSFELNYKNQIKEKTDVKFKRWCLKDLEIEKCRFIKVIDSDELNHFPILRKTLLELERKFPILRPENRGGVHIQGVSAPVNLESCKKFTTKDWKRSFSRYSSNEDRDWDKGLGGLSDHARQFHKVICESPNIFIPFIEELIDDDKIAHEYLIQAMDGLKDGNCELATFEKLFHKMRRLKFTSYHLESVVRLSDYFIQKKHINIDILNFIIDTALNTEEVVTHGKGEDIISNGLGSVRGSAVHRLTQINFAPQYKDQIFETLNKIAIEGNEVLTATLLRTLSTLRMLDKEATLNTFLLTTNTLTLDIAKNALDCLHCIYYDDFSRVIKFVEEAMEFNEVLPELSKIVGFAWLTNRKGAGRLLVRILEKDVKARAMMVFIAEKNMWDRDEIISKRSKELFIRYLNSNEEEVIINYSSAFVRFGKEYFMDLLPLLKKYSKSKVAIKGSISFIKYLSKCSKGYPCECIDLISDFEKYEFEQGAFHRVSPISVVVGAINSLNQITRKTKKDEEYIEKGISLFDSMLKDSRLRNFAENALQEIN